MARREALEFVATWKDEASGGLAAFDAKLAAVSRNAGAAASNYGALSQAIGGFTQKGGAAVAVADRAGSAFQKLEKEGLRALTAAVPGAGGALGGLQGILGAIPGPIKALVGAGALLLTFLRDLQNQATQTVADVTNLSAGIGAGVQKLVQDVAAVQAAASFRKRDQVQAEFNAVAIGAEEEKNAKIRSAQATLDQVLPFSLHRKEAEATFRAEVAQAEHDANTKIVLAAAQTDAKLVALAKERADTIRGIHAAAREAALSRTQTEAASSGSPGAQLGAVDAGVQKRRADIQDELTLRLRAIQEADLQGQEAEQARAAAAKIALDQTVAAEQSAAKERVRINAEAADQIAQLELRRAARARELAGAQAGARAAGTEAAALGQEQRGDVQGAIATRGEGQKAALDQELADFQGVQAEKVASAEAAAKKIAATEGSESAAAAAAREEAEDQVRQAKALTAAKAEELAKKQAAVEITTAKQAAQERMAQAQGAISANRTVVASEQSLADARTSAAVSAIQGEAELKAQRQRAVGDALGAERTLLEARVDAATRAAAAEEARAQRAMAALQAEAELLQKILQTQQETGDTQGALQTAAQLAALTNNLAEAQTRAGEAASQYRTEVELAEDAMSRLGSEATKLPDVFSALDSQAKSIADSMNNFSAAIAAARGPLGDAQARIDAIESAMSRLGGERTNLTAAERLEQQRAALADQLAQAVKARDALRRGLSGTIMAQNVNVIEAATGGGGSGGPANSPEGFQGGLEAGNVPGPPGAPRLVQAHGGEVVANPVQARELLEALRGHGARGGDLVVQVINQGLTVVDSQERMYQLAGEVGAHAGDRARRGLG